MSNLEDKIAKADQEIKQLQNKKKRLLSQQRNQERKARTHRLIERGAILESLLENPEQYTNEQIKVLLATALKSSETREFIRSLVRMEPPRD